MSETKLPVPMPEPPSPPWGRNVKFMVAAVALILIAYLIIQFTALIRLVVIASMLAFILNPLINLIDRRTPLQRSNIIILVYVGLAVAVIWALIALGIAGFTQLSNLFDQFPTLVADLTIFLDGLATRSEPLFSFGPFQLVPSQFPWEQIREQAINLIQPVTSRAAELVGSFATATLSTLANLFFAFMISIYMALEFPRLGSHIANFAQAPGYRADAERLTRDFSRIWSAYLRGQVILGLVIFVVVWLGLAVLGVENALALGILSGFLEFVPNLGPIVSAIVAVIVALFQQTNYLNLEPWQLAVAVIIFMLIVQQLENTVLVPRIVGEALDLHPLVVLVSVFMGASIAGILGAVLAAPVTATLKLVGVYAWRKMLDLPPFPEPEAEEPPENKTSILGNVRKLLPASRPKDNVKK
ncbi:MAG: AI-2E family transporter [Chloroflexota bacterium]